MRRLIMLVLIWMSIASCQAKSTLWGKDYNNTTINKNPTPMTEIGNSLLKTPNDKATLTLALEQAIAQKNWTQSIEYANRLLAIDPNSEGLLRVIGDLYSAQKDYTNAIIYYKKLVETYPNPEYQVFLVNLYMANQDFEQAQFAIEPIYNAYPNNPMVIDLYLSILLAQQKTARAYWVIKNNHLEETVDGYMVLGDMAMKDKNYELAESHYKKAAGMDPESLILQNRLAQSYRMLGYTNGPTKIYKEVLAKDPSNLEARLGLGYVEMDKKNYNSARQIFNDILKDYPNYRYAKMAIANSYLVDNEKINGIAVLDTIPQDDETKLMKAQAYYNMNMWTDSKKTLKGVSTKEAEALKYKLRRNDAITITPTYSFFFQQLEEEFDLDLHKFGINIAKNVDNNKNVFMEYNVLVYTSGHLAKSPDRLNNVVHELKGGVQARPTENWEYHADLGAKVFEFRNEAMIITDSWIKHYYNDQFNIKAGFMRNNVEQSYVSAVGANVDGVFTGRAAYNKAYVEFEKKLPNQFYTYGRGAYGTITAQNLPTNQYIEGLVAVGRLLYDNSKNKWINTFSADIVCYNSAYQYNLSKLYNSAKLLFGGYFSPSYFNATTLNLKAEGNIKKWHLRYGLRGFGGIQTSESPDSTTPAWGFSPYLAYDLNDNICINLAYNHYDYASVLRDQFIFSAVIRGFNKHAKN